MSQSGQEGVQIACGPATPVCVAIILDALGKAAIGTAAVLGTAAVIDEGSRLLAEKLAEGDEQSERDRNVEASEAKGIPKDRLGPSGKPKIHNTRFPTRKGAKDAARQAGKGAPIPHSPAGGRPHFHPADAAGRKIPGQHFEY